MLAIMLLLFITWRIRKESTIPMKQPRNVRTRFSTMNCPTRVVPDAPNAFLTPISEDRSMILLMLMLIKFRVGNNIKNRRKRDVINTSFVMPLSSELPKGEFRMKLAR